MFAQHAQEKPTFETIFGWKVVAITNYNSTLLYLLLLGQDYLHFCHWEVRLLIARLELPHNLNSLASIIEMLSSIVSSV